MPDTPSDTTSRFAAMARSLPVAHKVAIGACAVVVGLAAWTFVRWATSPSYSVLASGVDATELATIATELDNASIGYELEDGGTRIMVERSDLGDARRVLGQAGVDPSLRTGEAAGYELLDDIGFSTNNTVLDINHRRALEGEIARTLRSLERVSGATVHLAIPDTGLFGDPEPVEASVTLDVPTNFSSGEVEGVVALVAAAVPNLEPTGVTVVDVRGRSLASPLDGADNGALGGRNLRRTREFEQTLEADVGRMLLSAGAGDRSTVVVQARLNFDETTVQRQTYDEESQIPLRQSTRSEEYLGDSTAAPGGIAGVDAVVEVNDTTGELTYQSTEDIVEYGVDSVVSSTVQATGTVEQLHIGVVVDDGTRTGNDVLTADQVRELVSAAVGLDTSRGDTIAVTSVPFPALLDSEPPIEITTAAPADGGGGDSLIPQMVGAAVLLVVAIALISMARGRGDGEPSPTLGGADMPLTLPPRVDQTAEVRDEVAALVERQPEEIASLLRGWLAER